MAAAALIAWPLVTLILFRVLGAPRGLIWSVAVGYLFLPEGYAAFDMPVIKYTKPVAITFSVLLATIVYHRPDPTQREHGGLLKAIMYLLFLTIVVVAPVGTFMTNPEELIDGPRIRPGLVINDLLADMADQAIRFLPLLVAFRLLTRPEHHRDLLIALLVLGFAYTFLVLFERRMAPQLNMWVYGYFPHNWLQHIRGGGYRPLVFLRHGLWLGFFLFTVFIAALALTRDKEVTGRGMLPFLALWLLLVIYLSRNLGPTLLAIAFAPVVLFLAYRLQAQIAAVLAIMLLFYPVLHKQMEVPMERFLGVVGQYSADRVQSFQTRLENETELLERANEKPVFGWGGWARMRIIDERGVDTSLVDGAWIVYFGRHGWVGYIGFFGLLTVPILFAAFTDRRKPITPAIGGMMVMMAGNYIYVIPNSTINPIAMLILGSIAAFAQHRVEIDPGPRTVTRYSRFGHGGEAQPTMARPDPSMPHSRSMSTSYSSRSRRKSGA